MVDTDQPKPLQSQYVYTAVRDKISFGGNIFKSGLDHYLATISANRLQSTTYLSAKAKMADAVMDDFDETSYLLAFDDINDLVKVCNNKTIVNSIFIFIPFNLKYV